ncbi:hypothetical protein ASG40_12820 [Methylobacterium sp. Leaf399]|uniref:PD-(D/E)XK nuclease-like domain-containing protein n=1 Tax=unclassified Methylobacterium TaxID=2615210 RepID=UPI0006F5CC20|nr:MULTISPECIES: PD-(D/E)XK nuclease-like domain-containing protein [unclassified Methylobacterium]KQP50959.1 hypothetical protein ASF39_11200 [Methylobacterium sp. Leaf108]KQT07944.1 hypothetical protein ASG40_12820 [Methylobacterium sp. Leaf399]
MDIIEHTEGRVPGPGLYRMPAKVYHADPAPEPSLSSSIAKLFLTHSPEHAWAEHPRLGKAPDDEVDPSRVMEVGSAVHKLILGQGADLVIIDADDYRTKDAKAARAAAYAAGNAPILKPDIDKAEAMAGRFETRMALIPGCEGFAQAQAEVVAVVRDRSGAWLRIMMDKVEIDDHGAVIWDVKSGNVSAAPQGLGRRVEQMGMEVQAAFYVRALETLLPRLAGRVRFRWAFIENDVPHGLSVAEADAVGMGIGARKVDVAIQTWNGCLETKVWPGYPAEIIRVEYPEWAANRWTEREVSDPQLASMNYDPATSPHRPYGYGDAA